MCIRDSLSSDAQVDTGIEGKRNQRLLELNRERILEDFKLRAERLDILKRKHPKFADKPGWKSLLELGDMNKFIELSYKDRKDLITSIQKAVAQLTSETNNIEPEDMAALHDLIQLTIPKSALPIEFKQNLSDTLPTEFAQLTAEQQEQTKQNLRSLLKESLPNSIKMLTEFNEETKSLQKDLKSLENIKRIKNIGIAVFWVLGTVAAICMLAHVAIIIGPIVLGMEVFAIAAKVGFYFYHTKHHEEAEASNALQTKFLNTFKPLLPETTKVLETISYKNKASGFGERIDQGITGKLSKLENTEWSRRYLSAKEGVSAAATTAKEKLTAAKTAIVSHPRYLSAKESINKAQTNIKTSLAQSKPGKWIASHQTEDPEDELDASEFSLITPKPKSI